jgi:hypothetical protein
MNPIHKIPTFCFEHPWIKSLKLNLNSITVGVNARTLRATWTPELAQDISALHNIDVEAELTAILSQQIANEIDHDIINNFLMGTHEIYVEPMDPPTGQLFYIDFIIYDTPPLLSNGNDLKINKSIKKLSFV